MMQAQKQYDFRTKYTQGNFLTRRLLGGFFDAMADMLHGLQIRDAFEIGCGEGFSTQQIRRMLPGATLEAADVEDRLVDEARRKNPGVMITRESVYELPRTDRSADVVFLLEVLEHLSDPDKAMAEVCRVSRRYVLASVPREPLWSMMNLSRLKYIRSLGNTPGHVQHWSASRFGKFVSSHASVLAVRKPLPWTMVLAEVR